MVLYAPVEPPSMYAITLVLVKTRFNQDLTEKNCITHTAKHVHPVKSTSVCDGDSSSFVYLAVAAKIATAPCLPGRLLHISRTA